MPTASLRLFHAAIVTLTILSVEYDTGSWCPIRPVSALSAPVVPIGSKQQWVTELQRCVTLEDVVDRMGPLVSATSPSLEIGSLILVRVSKLLMALDNQGELATYPKVSLQQFTSSIIASLQASSGLLTGNIDALVDGTKACAILSRLVSLHDPDFAKRKIIDPWWQFWVEHGPTLVPQLQDHHLSGIVWSLDSFVAASNVPMGVENAKITYEYPKAVLDAYEALELPFRILPNFLNRIHGTNHTMESISVASLMSEVEFRTEKICTAGTDDRVVERRCTAWQGDVGVAPFAYSGKSMERRDWTPIIGQIRDQLHLVTGQYYDGCLLNLYPDGRSGMRYHQDPDQGVLWDYDTAVVSIGATRRFSFRSIPAPYHDLANTQPHNFVVMDGDVTYMFGNCQQRFQHAVKNAEPKNETAPRISLVFKRTWGRDNPAPKVER